VGDDGASLTWGLKNCHANSTCHVANLVRHTAVFFDGETRFTDANGVVSDRTDLFYNNSIIVGKDVQETFQEGQNCTCKLGFAGDGVKCEPVCGECWRGVLYPLPGWVARTGVQQRLAQARLLVCIVCDPLQGHRLFCMAGCVYDRQLFLWPSTLSVVFNIFCGCLLVT
jgi:hypothetical protein